MPTKGQSVSKEIIAKKNKTFLKNNLKKYKWKLAEPYLDIDMSNGKGNNRKRNHITLRKFKERIINGESINDIQKDTSKNLASFYSKFCQGKIPLTKEKFIDLYHQGKSLEEIANKYNISCNYIGFLRKLYDIDRKGATFINRKKIEIPLTDTQKEIIWGSMLGDAGYMSSSSIKFKHGSGQQEYLIWKYKKLKNIALPHSLQSHCYYTKQNKKCYSHRFYTQANTDCENCIKEFYKNGDKQITQYILNKLTPLSIAVWFMDDGYTSWGYTKILKGWNVKPSPYFCTECFSLEECKLIINYFKKQWGLNSALRNRKLKTKLGYRIKIKDYQKFFDLIRPHIIPSMMYKIDYQAYLKKKED